MNPSRAGSNAGPSAAASDRRLLIALTLVAFALRLILRLARGEADFLQNGYTFYAQVGQTFLGGGGLCLEPGLGCALRMPAYPLLIAPFLVTGWLYPGLAIVQSAIGVSLVWLAWGIGRHLFDRNAGLLAAAAAAFNPYAVIHDTALQETVVVNTLIAFAVWLLLRSRRTGPGSGDLGAGLALSLAVLATTRVALLVPFALLWVVVAGPRVVVGVRRALLMGLPLVMLVGGWAVRNWVVVGAPVLTTEVGESFWAANSEWTLEFLPDRSIDLAVERSYDELSPEQWLALEALNGLDVARDRLLASWGWEYVGEHPGEVLWNAGRKLWSAASGRLSPSSDRSRLESAGYALIFVPVHLLAAIGLWRARDPWRDHLLVGFVLLAFAATTAVFWAHTSHKSYIDVFLFVSAAAGLVFVQRALRGSTGSARPALGGQ